MKFLSTIISFLLLALCATPASAKNKKEVPGKPDFILVQLRSETSRINGAIKTKRADLLEVIKKDGAAIASAMMNDFKDNFKFCPVYFYMDTNMYKVINKQFDGILMDADGHYVQHVPINKDSKDSRIVYYGKPVPQYFFEKVVTDSSDYNYRTSHPDYTGLVVCNNIMQQMDFFKSKGLGLRYYKKNVDTKYWYKSSKFEMDYFPIAKRFSDNLKEEYSSGKWRIAE